MNILFCVMVLLPIRAHASFSTEDLYYIHGGKRIQVPVGEISGIRVNDICLNQQNECIALKKLHEKSKISQLKRAIPGNAPGSYCTLLAGAQLFLERSADKEKSQFCVFSDLSMIDAKELYLRHYAQK